MPTYEQHIKKYNHNRVFCRFGITSSKAHDDFSDWEVTVQFYAAVHLIEAIMEKHLNEHSLNHSMRDKIMGAHPDIFSMNCARDYASLKALARKARYEAGPTTPKEALKAQECLEDMELECQAYLS